MLMQILDSGSQEMLHLGMGYLNTLNQTTNLENTCKSLYNCNPGNAFPECNWVIINRAKAQSARQGEVSES